ncbi:MAG: hypothetical protein OES46_11320 [Gammaproteobacteria bacterium]|nr:hypothetical protein [Gammaproteobacteria bacterium]
MRRAILDELLRARSAKNPVALISVLNSGNQAIVYPNEDTATTVGHAICVPTFNGERGNPVLWAKCFFPEISEIAGDVGARCLILKHTSLVREVEMGDQAVLLDVDTAQDLTALCHPGLAR